MTQDIKVLTTWILICVFVAAVGSTAVPILYAFSNWRARRLGQLFMLQAVAFAIAIDFTFLFNIWTPKSILVLFWLNALVFTFIAASTTALTWYMWKLNHPKKRSNMLLNDSTYKVLKFLAQILLPALGALYFGLAQIWHLPKAEEVVGSVTVIDTFLGLILGLSTKAYNDSDVKYDGVFSVVPHDDGSALRLTSVDHNALDPATGKEELLFKVVK